LLIYLSVLEEIGIKGLMVLIKSLNFDAKQLAVRQIAEISGDFEVFFIKIFLF
jgi:hypothetical protein